MSFSSRDVMGDVTGRVMRFLVTGDLPPRLVRLVIAMALEAGPTLVSLRARMLALTLVLEVIRLAVDLMRRVAPMNLVRALTATFELTVPVRSPMRMLAAMLDVVPLEMATAMCRHGATRRARTSACTSGRPQIRHSA